MLELGRITKKKYLLLIKVYRYPLNPGTIATKHFNIEKTHFLKKQPAETYLF